MRSPKSARRPQTSVAVRGQIPPMEEMFTGLRNGLLLAVVVIFLLLAANFQSIRLSLVVISTVPAVLAGVALTLWLTHTTLNIQSFMGAIMAVGVAVANAILLVTYAERARMSGDSAAALTGATSRLRPILMTSFAMMAGMLPMALRTRRRRRADRTAGSRCHRRSRCRDARHALHPPLRLRGGDDRQAHPLRQPRPG